jgi:hypothetical protein
VRVEYVFLFFKFSSDFFFTFFLFVAELHCYSIGQITLRPGTGARAYCIAETSEVVPFQISFSDMEKELEEGGGKAFPARTHIETH